MVRGNLVIPNGGQIFAMLRNRISPFDFGFTVLKPYHQLIFMPSFDYHHLRYHHLALWQTSNSHVTDVTCDSDTPLFEKMWQGSYSDTLTSVTNIDVTIEKQSAINTDEIGNKVLVNHWADFFPLRFLVFE